MPNRYIRESAIVSESVNSLSWMAEVFYRRLLNKVDDFGRYTANLALLRAATFPLQMNKVKEADIFRALTECEAAGLVFTYSNTEGKPLLVLNKWEQGRAKKSDYAQPPPDVLQHMQTYVYGCKHIPPTPTPIPTPLPKPTPTTSKAASPTPLPFDSAGFRDAWNLFEQHRREIRKPLTKTATDLTFDQLSKIGEVRAIAAIRHTIQKGWQGIREPEGAPAARFTPPKPKTQECPGWKAILNHEFPDSIFAAGGAGEAHEWGDVSNEGQQAIWKHYHQTK